MQRRKTIQPQHKSTKWCHIHRHLRHTRLLHIQSRIIRTIAPPRRIQTRTNPRLPKCPVIMTAAASRHKQNVRTLTTTRMETRWSRHVQMRSPEIGLSQRRVDVLARKIRTQRYRLTPIHKIRRRGATDRPQLTLQKMPEITHILPLTLRPERHILRIKRILLRIRNHRFRTQLAPVNTITRNKCHQTGFHRTTQCLKPLLSRHTRTHIQKRRKIVTVRSLLQNHVVLATAINLHQPQPRLRPVHPVPTLTIPRHLRLITIKLRSPAVSRIQTEQIAVPNHSAVLHRIRRLRRRLSQYRLLQSQFQIPHPLNQKTIHKQLTPTANLTLHHRARRTRCRLCPRTIKPRPFNHRHSQINHILHPPVRQILARPVIHNRFAAASKPAAGIGKCPRLIGFNIPYVLP